MRIGFTSIYAWRPHVEHLAYLAGLAEAGGHAVSFLTCDSDLEHCYTKALRPEVSDFVHCTRCRVGGVRSYAGRGVHSIGSLVDRTVALPAFRLSAWSAPGSATDCSCCLARTASGYRTSTSWCASGATGR